MLVEIYIKKLYIYIYDICTFLFSYWQKIWQPSVFCQYFILKMFLQMLKDLKILFSLCLLNFRKPRRYKFALKEIAHEFFLTSTNGLK